MGERWHLWYQYLSASNVIRKLTLSAQSKLFGCLSSNTEKNPQMTFKKHLQCSQLFWLNANCEGVKYVLILNHQNLVVFILKLQANKL